jgi:hypothetical protein
MSLDSKVFKQFSMISVKILKKELQREMGLKREKFGELFSVGMRAKKVELVAPPSFCFCSM